MGDERHRELVGLLHHDLMVAGVRIKEAEGFTPQGRVDYLVYALKEMDPLGTLC